MADSDSLYHRLFSHPQMVEEVVREFVPEALSTGLHFSCLQRVNPKFHIRRGTTRRREGDIIWRLPNREGTDVYLLIEFQSESDWWMAVRTEVYQGLLWQQVIDEKKLQAGARLPPLLLLVLYNGEQRWKAPTETSQLIALSPGSALWPWQPKDGYYLLDMGAFDGDDLARRSTLAALLFRIEQASQPYELESLLSEVAGWFDRHEGTERLRELFAELVHGAFVEFGVKVPVAHDLLETKMMKSNLPKLVERWGRDLLAKGAAAGRAEGKAESLIRLLTARFGVVPPALHNRIRTAAVPTVERWFDRAIEASDLASVFD